MSDHLNATVLFASVQAALPPGTNSTVQLEAVALHLSTLFSQATPTSFLPQLYALSGLLGL